MKQQIIQRIASAANRGQNDFDEEAKLVDDLMMEDMDLLLLQLDIEDLIECSIDDKKWLRCKTVQDVITLAGEQLATH